MHLAEMVSDASCDVSNTLITVFYSLGFGESLDFSFLQKLSSEHHGMARKIYTGADAVSQLTGFYNEISSPVLSNVKITYLDENGKELEANVTETQFINYFNGSEIVVAGRLKDKQTHSVQVIHLSDHSNRFMYFLSLVKRKFQLLRNKMMLDN